MIKILKNWTPICKIKAKYNGGMFVKKMWCCLGGWGGGGEWLTTYINCVDNVHWPPYRVSKAHCSSVYPWSEHSHNGLTLKTSDFFEFITQLIKSKYPIQRVCGSVVERRITESELNSFEELKISFFVPGRKCHSRKLSCQKLAWTQNLSKKTKYNQLWGTRAFNIIVMTL